MSESLTQDLGAGIPPASTPRHGGDGRGARALAWWRGYCDPTNPRADAAARARLRRARSHLDVLRIEPAIALARRMGAVPESQPISEWRVYAALDLARVLARVKQHDQRHPMQAAGWQHFPGDRSESDAGPESPRLSEARFRRLLETGEGEEKVLAFTRLIALLDGSVNVAQLATDFLDWNHPEYGDRVRERWAFFYFAAGSAAPAPVSTTDDADLSDTTDTEDDRA